MVLGKEIFLLFLRSPVCLLSVCLSVGPFSQNKSIETSQFIQQILQTRARHSALFTYITVLRSRQRQGTITSLSNVGGCAVYEVGPNVAIKWVLTSLQFPGRIIKAKGNIFNIQTATVSSMADISSSSRLHKVLTQVHRK